MAARCLALARFRQSTQTVRKSLRRAECLLKSAAKHRALARPRWVGRLTPRKRGGLVPCTKVARCISPPTSATRRTLRPAPSNWNRRRRGGELASADVRAAARRGASRRPAMRVVDIAPSAPSRPFPRPVPRSSRPSPHTAAPLSPQAQLGRRPPPRADGTAQGFTRRLGNAREIVLNSRGPPLLWLLTQAAETLPFHQEHAMRTSAQNACSIRSAGVKI